MNAYEVTYRNFVGKTATREIRAISQELVPNKFYQYLKTMRKV